MGPVIHSERPARVPRRKTKRRWRIPPALPREPDDPNLEALPVLQEFPGDAGLLLWLSVRDVILWASTPPESRALLFTPGAARRRSALAETADLSPELDWALRSVAGVLSATGETDVEALRLACVQLSRWADGRGAGGTALWFAQAAALMDPSSAERAVEVGQLALAQGRLLQAETWLRRTIGMARRSGEWHAYARAFVHLAEILARRGDTARARRACLRAVRASRRHAVPEVYRIARIALMRIAMQEGAYATALSLAESIRRGWNPAHPGYPSFALDYAGLKLRAGEPGAAASTLKALILRPLEPLQRLRTASLLARAAATVHDVPTMLAAWDETERLLRGRPDDVSTAAALLDLAHAADSSGYHSKAVELASRAYEIALDRADAALADAARILKQLR